MKRIIILILMFCLFTVFAFAKEEIKNFYLRETSEPAPEKMRVGFESISAEDAESYLGFLASDLLEGRDTTSKMYDIAAEFVAVLFRTWKIQPAGDFPFKRFRSFFQTLKEKKKNRKKERTYFQGVVMKELLDYDQSITLHYRKGSINHSRTFYPDVDYSKSYFHIYSGRSEEISSPVVFVGYGISEKSLNFDEYRGIDVKGKVVLMLRGMPWEDKEDSPLKKGKFKEKYYPSPEQFRKQGWISPQLKLAREKGAVAVLVVGSPGPAYARRIMDYKINKKVTVMGTKYISLFQDFPLIPGQEIPFITITGKMTEFISRFSEDRQDLDSLKDRINSKGIPQSRELPGVFVTISHKSQTQLVKSRNVLGFIEGSHPELKKEVVVVGAHLDHMGKSDKYIYNGANDNASGSVAVLELAQAFALNPVKPKRSILFALWTGEERQLAGSTYYVTAPYFPLEKTAAYLNVDMIGWVWENKEIMARYHEFFGDSIPGEIFEKIDIAKFLILDLADPARDIYNALKESSLSVGMSLYLINEEDDIIASDCTPFFQEDIPCVHISTGNSEKYHKAEDDIEYIDFDLVERVSRLVYLTAFRLADQ